MEFINSGAMTVFLCFLTFIGTSAWERKQSRRDSEIERKERKRLEEVMEKGFKQTSDAMAELSARMEEQNKEITEIKMDLLRNYVSVATYEKHKSKCDQSFKEIQKRTAI